MAIDPLDRAARLHDRAVVHHMEGRARAARRDAVEAHRRFSRHAGPRHPDTASALDTLAMLDLAAGDTRAAARRLRRAVAVLERWRRHPAVRPLLAQSVERLGECLRDAGRYDEARVTLRRAVGLRGRVHGRDSLEHAVALNQLGMCCKYAGWFAEGVRAYHAALAIASQRAPDGELVRVLLHNLGGIEHARDRFAAAERYARRGVELRMRTDGPAHPSTELDLGALAPVLLGLGRLDEAEGILRPLLDSFARRYGRRHHEVAVVCHNLGALLAERGALDEAAARYREALSIKRARLGADHPDVAITALNLAAVEARRGRARAARALLEATLPHARRALGARHPTTRACDAALRDLA